MAPRKCCNEIMRVSQEPFLIAHRIFEAEFLSASAAFVAAWGRCSTPSFSLGSPAMTLVNAAYLGIERFANDRNNENWSAGSSQADKAILIRAVYRQVLGYQYVMESERLTGA